MSNTATDRTVIRWASLSALILLATLSSAYAQDRQPIFIGLLFDRTITGSAFGSVPVYVGGSLACGEFKEGDYSLLRIGGMAILPDVWDVWGRAAGPAFGLSYVATTSQLVAPPTELFIRYDTINDRLDTIPRQFTYAMRRRVLEVPISVRYSIGPAAIGLSLAPSIDLSTTFEAKQVITDKDHTFTGEGSEKIFDQVQPLTAAPFTMSFGGDVSYRFPAGRYLALLPTLSFRTDLLSLVEEYNWRGWSLGAGIAIVYDIAPDTTAIPPPLAEQPRDTTPPVVESPLPAAPTASIGLFAMVGERRVSEATVSVHETLVRKRAPLQTSYFFDRNSSALPARYGRMTKAEADRFTLDSLVHAAPSEISERSLDVIGYRLREDPKSSIWLSGGTSKGEPSWLAYARAENVRTYLEKTWGIEQSRMEVRHEPSTARPTGGGGRSVTIASTSVGILAPIVISRVLSDFDPPRIKLEPTMQAPAGMKEWTITLSNDERQIGRYSSNDGGDAARRALNWQIPTMGTDRSTLRAALLVEDSLGRRANAEGSMPMTITRTLRVIDERLDEKGTTRKLHLLPASARDHAGRWDAIVDALVASVTPRSRIYVNAGTAEESKRLASTLESLVRARGLRGVNVQAVERNDERLAVELPEGYATPDGPVVAMEQ